MVIESFYADDGLYCGLKLLSDWGVQEDSRNGKVLTCPHPVIAINRFPMNRVSFSPSRDANPFFHLFEAMWMLAGRRDVGFISQFNSNIKNYSDNGIDFNAAYGHRWRVHFGWDQIEAAIRQLARDSSSRRVVVGAWDNEFDLMGESKDIPCNTHMYFRVTDDDRLNLTVCNRSNDLVWGMYGANIVHMSFLQEYVMERADLKMGKYYQFSNNLHLYEKHWGMINNFTDGNLAEPEDYPEPTPMGSTDAGWDDDLVSFMHRYDQLGSNYKTNWFRNVIGPLGHAWWSYKEGRIEAAIDFANQCEAKDWRKACVAWLERRKK